MRKLQTQSSGSASRRLLQSVAIGLTVLVTTSCAVLQLVAQENPPEVTISVIGDVMCHEPQLHSAYNASTRSYDFHRVFRPVEHLLSRADVTIANLETTLPGRPDQYSGYPQFGAPDSLAQALKDMGVDVLTLANNHSVDKLRAGMLRTIEVVDGMGFQHLGTYQSPADWQARRILMVERNGIRLAFLNYTYGTNGIRVPPGTVVNLIEGDRIAADIKAAREMNPDAIVVLYHFGGEYLRQPDEYQRRWVNFAFHHGADIVIGGHPHVLQPFGVREIEDMYGVTKERLVAYSLGNFVSNQQRRYTDGGKIFHFTVVRNPDRDSPQRVLFKNIYYDPIWVYVEQQPNRRQYHVLPVRDYLENQGEMRLPAHSYNLMMRFYRDTTAHLQPSVDGVASYTRPLMENEDAEEGDESSEQVEEVASDGDSVAESEDGSESPDEADATINPEASAREDSD